MSDPWHPSSPALSSLSCCDSVACRPFSCSSFLSQIPGLSPSVRGQRPSFHGVSPPSYYCVNFWFPGSSSLPSQATRGTWMLPRSHLDISPTSSCPVSKLTNLTTLLQIFWPIPLPGSLCLIWNLGTSPGEGLDLRWAPSRTSIHCEVVIISGIPSHSPQKSCFLNRTAIFLSKEFKIRCLCSPISFLASWLQWDRGSLSLSPSQGGYRNNICLINLSFSTWNKTYLFPSTFQVWGFYKFTVSRCAAAYEKNRLRDSIYMCVCVYIYTHTHINVHVCVLFPWHCRETYSEIMKKKG